MTQAQEAKSYLKAYQGDISLLRYVPRLGIFRDKCLFCSLCKWCDLDFDPDLADECTKEYHLAPWENEEREIIKET